MTLLGQLAVSLQSVALAVLSPDSQRRNTVESRGGTHSKNSGASAANVDDLAQDGERVASGSPTEQKKGSGPGGCTDELRGRGR